MLTQSLSVMLFPHIGKDKSGLETVSFSENAIRIQLEMSQQMCLLLTIIN
jgi:hypothetical protein